MNSITALKRLFKYVAKEHKFKLIIVTIAVIIQTVATASISLSLKFIIDDYITPLINQVNPDFTELYKALSILGTIFIAGALSSYLTTYLMVIVAQKTLKSLRDDIFNHMLHLPLKYFDQNNIGSIMSVYTNDTDTLRNMIEQSLVQLVSSTLTLITSLVVMIFLSPLLSIIAVLTLILLFTVTSILGKRTGKYFGAQQKNIADLTGFIQERISGQRVVKIFNHEEKTKEEFDKFNEELFRSNYKAQVTASMIGPVIGNIGNLQFVISSFIGGLVYLYGFGGLSLGVLISFLQFSKNFAFPFMQISFQFNVIIMAIEGSKRVFNLLDEPVEVDEGKVTLSNIVRDENGNISECAQNTFEWAWKIPNEDGSFRLVELKGEVKFEDMTFSYNENKVVLDNLNLYANPRQKLAFVGSTGAGKTTITNLINRFYDVQEGRITYDGIDVKNIKKDDLRRSLGIVLQDTHLFTDTIRENIRYGKLDATDEEVERAAKLAHADHFIDVLPEGYDTVMTSAGEKLSQGQRQLISIARAAISNPPVLILDEATSSIDTRTEKIVQNGMDNLMHGRTVFVIAHRLSTIKNSDAIIVLEHGKIIERGDHHDLLEKKGTYYQLYTGDLELD